MTGDRLDALINGEIDGVNSAAESEELAALLRADPAARHRREELHEAMRLLGRLEMVEPPPGLHQRIMAELGTDAALSPGSASRRLLAWTGALRGIPGWLGRPTTLPAFAAGVLVALLLVVVGRQIEPGLQAPATRDMLGLVMPEDGRAVATFHSSTPAVLGTWRAVQDGPRTLLSLELATQEPVTVLLEAGAGVTCAGFLGQRPPAGGMSISGGRIEMSGLSGGRFDLLFLQESPGALSFRARISTEGVAIDERTFTVGQGRQD
jgi:hypothetical protein